MTKEKTQVKEPGEWVKLWMKIEKVFDGSTMEYEVVDQPTKELSEKFKKVLREDWDVDVDEYTALVAIEESEVELKEEVFLFE